MKLSKLLERVKYIEVKGDTDTEISGLAYDSRKVTEGCIFVCIVGMKFDGHEAALEAVEKGAAALVVSKDIELPGGVSVIKTEDTRLALAQLSAAWFGYPAEKLTTIGITGTKGKTTTTYLVKSILEHVGRKVGLVGTIETIIGDERIPSVNTTPESYVLQESFAKMVEAGLDTVIMEASSQGFKLHRTEGFIFDIGIFTNLEPDHIGEGEHKDFQEYLSCKAKLFRQCRLGILNGDDSHMEEILKGHTCRVESYGLGEGCDLKAGDIRLVNKGKSLGVEFRVSGLMDMEAYIDMPGKFSVYNALCAIAICRNLGADAQAVKEGLKRAKVKGRIENIEVSEDFSLMIDYAHNAMALESLLTTLKEYEPGRLVSLFGCGGNRSKLRRFEMGEVSGRLADLTVITSDNPRFEEPLAIMDDIETGIKKTSGSYVKIADRKEAIKYVIQNGKKGDVIVLAGKGHEDYQEIKGEKHHMDERELIAQVLEELKNA